MKFCTLLVLIFFSIDSWALSIRCPEPLDGLEHEFRYWQLHGGRGYEFTAPIKLGDQNLSEIIIFLNNNEPDIGAAISISFKINEGKASGNFDISNNWSHIELIAYYGEDACDPKILASDRM